MGVDDVIESYIEDIQNLLEKIHFATEKIQVRYSKNGNALFSAFVYAYNNHKDKMIL